MIIVPGNYRLIDQPLDIHIHSVSKYVCMYFLEKSSSMFRRLHVRVLSKLLGERILEKRIFKSNSFQFGDERFKATKVSSLIDDTQIRMIDTCILVNKNETAILRDVHGRPRIGGIDR